MKRLFTLFVAVLLTASVFAQSPEKMSYQAVIRNSSNALVTNTQVGMQISILQGTASGTVVYTETQTPTTNANGLVSLEIGTGTTSDDFSSIDWANGPYFIKTETDPAGGTSYTITGTSQLLSVPYALHAKTAETVTGGITETDPIFGASVASGITGTDTTNWNNKLDSETDPVFTAWDKSTGISITESQISDLGTYIETETQNISDVLTLSNDANATQIKNLADPTDAQDAATKKYVDDNAGGGSTTYSVGDFAQGGIVFWVDETGQHGLVCAKEDQNGGSPVRWYAGTYGNTQAKGDGPYAGEANTSIIIAAQVAIGDDGATYAARICNELQVTESGKTYGDWYLPSKEELNLMYQNKATIDATAGANGGSGFASAGYWSSTENNSSSAWAHSFGGMGGQSAYDKLVTPLVRAVRAF